MSKLYNNDKTDGEAVKLGRVISYDKINAQGSLLPYLGMENIQSDIMGLVGNINIQKKTSSTFKFDESHVLYGRLRPYLKKVFLPSFKGQCSTEIFCIRPSEKLDRRYLAYWLLTPELSAKIEKTSTGARMPRANMNALLDFDIYLPKISNQQKIASKIDGFIAEIKKLNLTQSKLQTNCKFLKKN